MSPTRIGDGVRQAATGGTGRGGKFLDMMRGRFNEETGDRMPRISRAVVGVILASLLAHHSAQSA